MKNPASERVKLNLARLKKAGQVFEISVDPDLALRFKKGELLDIRDILKAEQIFSDAKKGELIPQNRLKEFFHTADPLAIARIIIKDGEVQSTSEYRAHEREQKKRQLIELIHRQAIDPATQLPLPLQRIELAFEQARLHFDENKPAEEQLEAVLAQLRPLLPIKITLAQFTLQFPPAYAPKAYPLVQKYSKILKETWNFDGSWTVLVEIPAGLKVDFLDKLNSFTHGEVVVAEKK